MDANVGEHIFSRCIKEVLKEKTILLVTHHLHVLPKCDKVIILNDDGSVLASGSYAEIIESGIDVEKFIVKKHESGKDEDPNAEELAESEKKRSEITNVVKESRQRARSNSDAHPNKSAEDNKPGKALMSVEEKNEGSVPLSTYWTYVMSG